MVEGFFQLGPQRAEKVKALFSRIAPRYDLINDLQSFGLHRHWKRRLLELARAQPGEQALDVCCGTGDLALGLAQRGLQVVGLDFSEPMLAIARRRASRIAQEPAPLSKTETVETGQGQRPPPHPGSSRPSALTFVQGDAQQLPFPDNSFEIVTIGYGLRNLADWELGLHEMLRAAKPGGRVLVLDFGKPENRAWRAVYFAYLRLFVPLLGLIFCGSASAYAYILESLKHYPAQLGVARKMRELGMADVRVVNFLGGVMSINYGEKS
jgi:demethylmenaquinone methyltransferase / 2-methoxy-6-polyprenyl-1,4-benzoquinol methylase